MSESRPSHLRPMIRFDSCFGAHDRNERHRTIAAFHGGEVRRFLRQARFGKSRQQTTQLIRKAKEHAKSAWHSAVQSERYETVAADVLVVTE